MTTATTAATITAARTARAFAPEDAATFCLSEYGRLVDLLRELEPADWERPTDCTRWTVRDIAGHLAGAAHNVGFTTMVPLAMRGLLMQRSRHLPELVDGMNEVQIRDHANDTPAQLVDTLQAAAPRQAALRRHPHWYGQLIRFGTGGQRISMRDLYVRILNRDLWIHRVDICRATDRDIQLTADHDARLVEDVVAAWATRHGKAFTLHLRGPAGGTYARGVGGESFELDAVEFCRTVSGRVSGRGMLALAVIF